MEKIQRAKFSTAPDLDAMTVAELEAWIGHYDRAWAGSRMFPLKPRNNTGVAKKLLSMAALRRMYLQTNRYQFAAEYERKYKQLPKYAQFRRHFNPVACALPGKSFRKHPPKPRPAKPLDLPLKRG